MIKGLKPGSVFLRNPGPGPGTFTRRFLLAEYVSRTHVMALDLAGTRWYCYAPALSGDRVATPEEEAQFRLGVEPPAG